MAVQLNNLYHEIYAGYDIRLQTESCFDKKISWVHMVENIDFVCLLHGDELVFNSSLNDEPEDIRKEYIDQLIQVDAGGLIIALQTGNTLSAELIEYCNRMQFPIFTASWNTPYINIMRHLAEILLDNERKEMNLVAALKNIISHPQEAHLFLDYFEQNNYSNDITYTIAILGLQNMDIPNKAENMKAIERTIQHTIKQNIIYEENNSLILLVRGYASEQIEKFFSVIFAKHQNIHLGIGSTEMQLSNLHRSYSTAKTAYDLSVRGTFNSPVYYNKLGTYQILTNLKNADTLCPDFIHSTLGKLIDYDKEHHSNYLTLIKDFFDNDCSITQTANATYFHQNTLKYKIKNIKEILGYDITTNENRVKIMLSLYMLELKKQIKQ